MWLEMETGRGGGGETGRGKKGHWKHGLSRMLMAQQVSGSMQVVLSPEGPLSPVDKARSCFRSSPGLYRQGEGYQDKPRTCGCPFYLLCIHACSIEHLYRTLNFNVFYNA